MKWVLLIEDDKDEDDDEDVDEDDDVFFLRSQAVKMLHAMPPHC